MPVLFDVTAGDFASPALTAHLAPLADRNGADRIVLRLLLDQPIHSPLRARQTVGALRRLGVGLVLADFGSGWSNLAALRHLVPDAVEVRLDTLRRWGDPGRGLEWICRLVHSVSDGPTIATEIADQPDATWALRHGAVLGHGPHWPGHELSESGRAAIADRSRLPLVR
ncbi:MAG: EAL domain-containing protein [Acidimicrobiales bacterium]|nr:EAL domain-containing protein [Acidimicrobiales bacterium]